VIPHESLWDVIGRGARETPHRHMIVEADGSAITYRDALEVVLNWSAGLGQQPGQVARRVAAVLPNSASVYLLRLACGQAGVTFLALNPLLEGSVLRDAIVRSAVTDLVVSRETAGSLTAIRGELPPGLVVHTLEGDGDSDTLRTKSYGCAHPGSPGDLAEHPPEGSQVVLYTSGTTGPAKPVRLSSRSIQSYATNLFGGQEPAWTPDAGYYSPWHPGHVLGAVALDVAVLRGLTLVLRRKFSRSTFWADIISYHCEATTLVAVAGDLRAHGEPWQGRNPLRLVGMSPLVEDVRDFERYFGVEVVSLYGMTEVGTALTARSPADSRITGWPVPGYQCRLVEIPGVDAVASRAGRVGELVVRPGFVTSEYDLGGEPATGGWEDGWFHTGDLFAEIGGAYSFVGRIKDSIRRHGRNISADDLESVVRTLPGVADCACVGVSGPHPAGRPATDDEIRIFVITRPDAVLDPERLMARMAECLPAFMLPRYLDIVPDLPRTLSGKVSRQALRQVPLGSETYDRKRPAELRTT